MNMGDDGRHNFATRVMSNGVEVIVAGGKSVFPGFRIAPSSAYKNHHTLLPTTLKDHMLLHIPEVFLRKCVNKKI